MARFSDLVDFLVSEYPRPQELTSGRLDKLIYLLDVEWAWGNGEQLTQTRWTFNNHGPFVGAGDSYVESLDGKKIEIHEDVTMYGDKKRWYEWKATDLQKQVVAEALTNEEKIVLRKVIEDTWRLPWGRFVKYVYSTLPMVKAKQYECIDIVGTMACRRKAILEKVTKESLEKYREDFKSLANL